MSDDKPTVEEAREIIKVRRVSAKPTPEKKNDEAEAAKAREAELKKRLRRLQISLAVAVFVFLLLGFRALGRSSSLPTTETEARDALVSPPGSPPDSSSDSPRASSPNAAPTADFRRLFSPEPAPNAPSNAAPTSLDAAERRAEAAVFANPLDDPRVVRIATWNLEPLDFAKVTDPKRGEKIAEIIREFDVVAVQGVRSKNRAVLEGLVYLISRQGGDYDYVASTSASREPISAIFFNARTIVVDNSSISEVYDARGRLRTPALVANFRPNEVAPESCFTFQIINLHLFGDSTDESAFFDLLATLKKSAGRFGLREDDLIVAGNFGAAIQKIKDSEKTPLGATLRFGRAIDDDATSANLLFDSVATVERVDRFGSVDLAEYFKISEEAAREIAGERPVWGDFSVYEGGNPEFSAPRPSPTPY